MKSIEIFETTYRRLRQAKRTDLALRIHRLLDLQCTTNETENKIFHENPTVQYSIDFDYVKFVKVHQLINVLIELSPA